MYQIEYVFRCQFHQLKGQKKSIFMILLILADYMSYYTDMYSVLQALIINANAMLLGILMIWNLQIIVC